MIHRVDLSEYETGEEVANLCFDFEMRIAMIFGRFYYPVWIYLIESLLQTTRFIAESIDGGIAAVMP